MGVLFLLQYVTYVDTFSLINDPLCCNLKLGKLTLLGLAMACYDSSWRVVQRAVRCAFKLNFIDVLFLGNMTLTYPLLSDR